VPIFECRASIAAPSSLARRNRRTPAPLAL
jgi:hypothetical protein